MNQNLNEKKILILGTGGSGKTVYAMKLWDKFKCPMAYDINGDFKSCKGGIAYNPSDIDGEFIQFLKSYFEITKKKKIDAIFFDDCDAYINYETVSHPLFKDLVVRHRNKHKVTLVFIGKRPQNIPTLIVENCHLMFIYKIEGHNAMKRLIDIDNRIEPMLTQVYENLYSYIEKWEGFPPKFKKAVKQ